MNLTATRSWTDPRAARVYESRQQACAQGVFGPRIRCWAGTAEWRFWHPNALPDISLTHLALQGLASVFESVPSHP